MRIGNLPLNNDVLGILLAIVSLVFSLGIGSLFAGGGAAPAATAPETVVDSQPTTKPEKESVSQEATTTDTAPPGETRMFSAASALSGAEVAQGKQIYILKDTSTPTSRKYTTCTLGFVNTSNKFAYTAGHCGREHVTGNEVFMNTSTNGGTNLVRIGTWEGANSNYQQRPTTGYFNNINFDFGYIRLDESSAPIAANANPFSGDTIENYVPKNGSRVCIYRSKTAPHVYCTEFFKTSSNYILVDQQSVRGESGGPVWVEGGGFFGVISGYGKGGDPRNPGQAANLVWIAPAMMADNQYL